MEKVYENIGKYGEKMEGKFSHNPSGNGIVISVTSPFIEEIRIDCDNDIYDDYRDTYRILEPQADHPERDHWKIYYNTQEKCYYRSEWRPKKPELQESEWGYVWVRTDMQYIIEHAQKYEKLQAHFRMFHNIHKGQLCVFTGYAIDPNGDCKKPSTVESKLILDNRTKWFYNPWSFQVSLLNEDTIDDFVEETPISKEMTDKMVLHHQKEDKVKQQKEKEDEDKKRKEAREVLLGNINAHFEKYQHFYRYGVIGGVLWLIGIIIAVILA